MYNLRPDSIICLIIGSFVNIATVKPVTFQENSEIGSHKTDGRLIQI
jgi:hypothetical protein